jgi:hypothetical protein
MGRVEGWRERLDVTVCGDTKAGKITEVRESRRQASGVGRQALGFRLSAFGFRLSAFGFRLSAFGFRLSAFGF